MRHGLKFDAWLGQDDASADGWASGLGKEMGPGLKRTTGSCETVIEPVDLMEGFLLCCFVLRLWCARLSCSIRGFN
jgi:hypothetical protein